MGTFKKEASRKERQGKTGDGMGNVRVKGENFYRLVHPLRQMVLDMCADLFKRCEEVEDLEYAQGW